MYRMLFVSGCLPTCCVIIINMKSLSDRDFWFIRQLSKCIRLIRKIGLEELKDESNIGYCNITKCCTKVCPEDITITDNAIIPLKERVVDEFYDPVKKILSLFRSKKK